MTSRLLIVCGIPGAGKSTFAHRAVERWGAVSFASEQFADALGESARSASGDLTREAIAHAYAAMGEAAAAALTASRLVVAVGSFRAETQRSRFREIARGAGAETITLRIVAPVKLAAERVRARIALGERGPTEGSIGRIDAELASATDIDEALTNDVSIEQFSRESDRLLERIR